jgi:mono/diheme cytochrome c family protein
MERQMKRSSLRFLVVHSIGMFAVYGLALSAVIDPAWATDPEILRPRVPPGEISAAKALSNPFAATPEQIQKGDAIFHGKGFCAACHGRDGKGLGEGLELKGPLPRDFTDRTWQAARADGELLWILKNGSQGTAMAPFIPLVLTEDEAWQVLVYVRSLGGR